MAVNEPSKGTSTFGRRLFWGTNVTLAVLLVFFLAVAINFLANKYNAHKDVSGGLTGHRLSDRTKQLVEKSGKITISTVYMSKDFERNAEEYLPKLRDFCDEIARCGKDVTVKHISSPNDQAALRQEVSAKFGSATSTHKEAMDQVVGDGALWDRLKKTLDARSQEMEQLASGNSWLKNFSSLAGRAGDLNKLSKNLEETSKEVKELLGSDGGLPKYSDATTKINTFNEDVKRDLATVQTWAKDMEKLATTLGDPNMEFARVTREKQTEIATLVNKLKEIAGDAESKDVPDDPMPVFKNWSTVAKTLSTLLFEEAGRVQTFLKDNPAMATHAKWKIRVDSDMVMLGPDGQMQAVASSALPQTVLANASQNFADYAQQVAAMPSGAPKDQLQGVVRQLRDISSDRSKDIKQLKQWLRNATAPFENGGGVDEASKKLLASLSGDESFKQILKEMDDAAAKLKALPEQKMDEVGERLKQDNIIVVETDKQVRIIPFDDVFPLVARRGMENLKKEGEPPARDFNGDAAIANALLDMQNDKPFATVILVSYESQPPPQMRQFQPPVMGPLPLQEFQALKDRLQRLNFAVKEWNLCPQENPQEQQRGAPPKPIPDPPAPEKDTQPIYVFLPPPEQPPMSMFMQQMPQKAFGAPEMAKVKEVLSKEGTRAIFLALGVPKLPGNPETLTFAYGAMLSDEWGITVQNNYRLMRALPSSKQPGMYNFDPLAFPYLRLNYFTDQPIGKPLRSRRVLLGDARGIAGVCPVIKTKDVPDVVVQTVLEVPKDVDSLWAEGDLGPVARALNERKKDSAFAKSDDVKEPPFSVILAAENTKKKSRIVVMGCGGSFLSGYMDRPVPRIEAEGGLRFSTDPPPTENAELFANALYWLGDHPDMIAAGPADVPFVGPIGDGTKKKLWAVTIGWAAAVLLAGGAVMFLRRR